MCVNIVLILASLLSRNANAASIYDQRQTGDLNVQVDLKDLRIFALLKGTKAEEYVDYDYAYDYSEMTIKPQSSTTLKPLNGTSAADASEIENSTIATTELMEQTTLVINNSNNMDNLESGIISYNAINDSTTTMKSLDSVQTEPVQLLNINKTESSTPSSTHCKKGFVVNLKGDCELKLQSTGNALLKLVKLSQKLKLRRENRRHQHDST